MKKYSILILLLLSLAACNTQIKEKVIELEKRVRADSIRLDSFANLRAIKFDQALRFESIDTNASKALYSEMNLIDSTDYWGAQSRGRLRFLKASSAKSEFIRKISGPWDWGSRGTNWGGIERRKEGILERKLIIKENGEIEFYENGKLTLADTYDIRSEKVFINYQYLLELNTSKKIFSIGNGKTRLTLSEPFCVCGCVVDQYYRKWKPGM